MAISYARLLEKQGFDDLMDFLDREFQKFPDHRAGNALRYDLADVLTKVSRLDSLIVTAPRCLPGFQFNV